MTEKKIDFEKVLEESVAQINKYAVGNQDNVEVVTYTLRDLPQIDVNTIKRLRVELNVSQEIFAIVVGVSKRTVEAWEIGRSNPNGSATRLMQLMIDNPRIKDSIKQTLMNENMVKREKQIVE